MNAWAHWSALVIGPVCVALFVTAFAIASLKTTRWIDAASTTRWQPGSGLSDRLARCRRWLSVSLWLLGFGLAAFAFAVAVLAPVVLTVLPALGAVTVWGTVFGANARIWALLLVNLVNMAHLATDDIKGGIAASRGFLGTSGLPDTEASASNSLAIALYVARHPGGAPAPQADLPSPPGS